MKTYNQHRDVNSKQMKKAHKDLRKLKMSNGSTITFFETNEAFKGLQHSYHYYEDDAVYEGDW